MMILLVGAVAMSDMEKKAKEIADPIIAKCKVNCAGENDWTGKYSGSFHSLFNLLRKNLRNDIAKALSEAELRGRKEGFEQALKEIELKRHGFLSVDQARELAETIRTAMEGK